MISNLVLHIPVNVFSIGTPDALLKSMLKRRPKELHPERRDPGENEAEYCSPGSIEQELDMCETGTLRGDEILYHHGQARNEIEPDQDPVELDKILTENYHLDLAEEDREGDDLSGDEHSSGLQGDESGTNVRPVDFTKKRTKNKKSNLK